MQERAEGTCAIEGDGKVQSRLFMRIHMRTESGPRADDDFDILKRCLQWLDTNQMLIQPNQTPSFPYYLSIVYRTLV